MDTPVRESREITTAGGHKLKLKTYITGREFQEIQSVYLKDAKLNMIGKEMQFQGFNPSSEFEATKKLIELTVISLDDMSEGVTDRVLDLPYKDYQEVVAALEEMSGKKKAE